MSSALIAAAKRGDLIALRKAIGSSPAIDQVDVQGWTALFHASGQGNTEAMRLLINAGADPNHNSETGFTPLFSAVLSQHIEAVKVLIEAGAKVVPTPGGGRLRGCAATHELKELLEAAESDNPRH